VSCLLLRELNYQPFCVRLNRDELNRKDCRYCLIEDNNSRCTMLVILDRLLLYIHMALKYTILFLIANLPNINLTSFEIIY
jgi:hypothetical protein